MPATLAWLAAGLGWEDNSNPNLQNRRYFLPPLGEREDEHKTWDERGAWDTRDGKGAKKQRVRGSRKTIENLGDKTRGNLSPTAISRKVVGKKRKVHATILKGSLGNNKYSFHWHREPTMPRSYSENAVPGNVDERVFRIQYNSNSGCSAYVAKNYSALCVKMPKYWGGKSMHKSSQDQKYSSLCIRTWNFACTFVLFSDNLSRNSCIWSNMLTSPG